MLNSNNPSQYKNWLKRLKWIGIFLLLCHSATLNSQMIASLDLPNLRQKPIETEQQVLLQDVLSQIEAEYGIKISYANHLITGKKVYSESILKKAEKGKDFQKILGKLLAPFELSFEEVDENRYVIYGTTSKSSKKEIKKDIGTNDSEEEYQKSASAQKVTNNLVIQDLVDVSGTILDDNGQPLPGASIVEKGTTNGAVSDFDGNYTLKGVDPQAVLVVSYIGYRTQEIPLNGQSTIDVTLQTDAQALDEVVIIGYGTTTNKDVTGSVKSVSDEDFNRGAILSPEKLIAGRVPGVQIIENTGAPGGGVSIRIRGGTSINASNEPLYVIDGVPIDNSSVGADGFSTPANPLNFLNPEDIETFTILKDASATAIFGSRGANGVVLITTKSGKEGSFAVSYSGYASVGQVVETVDVLDAGEFRNYIGGLDGADISLLGNSDTDWQDVIFRTAIGQNHALNLSGGTSGMNYRASIGYFDQEGAIERTDTRRTSYSVSVNSKSKDEHLTFQANVRGAATKDNLRSGVVGQAYRFDPTQRVFDPGNEFGGYFEYGLEAAQSVPRNPLAIAELTQDEAYSYRTIGNLKTDYKLHFFPDVKLTLNLAADSYNGERKQFQPSTLRGQASLGGTLRSQTYQRVNNLLDFYANYNKEFMEDHSFDLTLGYSYQRFQDRVEGFTAQDFSTNVLGSNSTAPAADDITFINREANKLISYFGRVNYSYKNKYLLTSTIRRDGSSRFGPANEFGVFPSVALGWRIIEEPFMQDSELFSNLKLRAGYGVNGNQEIGNYRFLPTYTFSDSRTQFLTDNGFATTARPNAFDPDLKWEETQSYNLGLDYGLFNGRIFGTIDYYHKDTDDLLFEVTVPAGTNLSNIILTNIGSVTNKGIEFDINSKIFMDRAFEWDLGLNISHNHNEITALDLVNDPEFQGYLTGEISGAAIGNRVQVLRVGSPVNSFFLYKHIRDENGIPLEDQIDHNGDGAINLADIYEDTNGDGTVDASDRRVIENPNPDVTFGLNSNMRYKNFDLNFTLRANIGNYVYNNVKSTLLPFTRAIGAEDLENVHRDATRVRMRDAQDFSDYFLENASFLKMDNITLGYNFKPLKNSKTNARIYTTVQNLFVITGYSGVDPEVGFLTTGDTTTNGIDNNIYPRSRNVIFGLNVNF